MNNVHHIAYRFILIMSTLWISSAYAQNYSGSGNNYTYVGSYDGTRNNRSFTVRLDGNNPFTIKEGWKLSVRAISTQGNKEFPIQKLSLIPHAVEGSASDPGPLPTLTQLGILPINTLHKNGEVFLIRSSSVPLHHRAINSSYFNFQLLFDFAVSGGNYLNSLKGNVYDVDLVFTFYRFDNSVLGTIRSPHRIQIGHYLAGTPPTENNFSITISNEAKNGLLEVKSKRDYLDGTRVTYGNGIQLSSNVPYRVTVKSQQANFTSQTGHALPLDAVHVKLLPTSTNPTAINEIKLSTIPQLLLQENSTSSLPHLFDIVYSTPGNDDRLFQTKSENYTTTLTYEITVL